MPPNGQPDASASPDSPALASGPSTPLPRANLALGLLLAINLFNYIDRQVLSAVLPKIALDAKLFDPSDPWMQSKLGFLTTAFMVSYMLLSPVFGVLGDRFSRWGLVGVGVILWSLASGSSGIAETYLVLFAMRCLVGVGEAAYGPIAPAMISDLYPTQIRGRVMAWFYMAIPVGSALGFVIGGQLAEHFGWRTAFHVTFVGVLLGGLCFVMRDPPRPTRRELDHQPGYFEVLQSLRGVRSFVLCCLGMTATTFILGGVAAWVPTYVFQREARFVLDEQAIEKLQKLQQTDGSPLVSEAVIGKLRTATGPETLGFFEIRGKLQQTLSQQELAASGEYIYSAATAEGSITTGKIGLIFGAIVVIAGIFATLAGGILGDRLRDRGFRGAYFKVAGWGTLLGWPFFLGLLFVPFPYAWGFTFLAVFWLFFNTGPANTILANVTRSEIRATAFAINILVIHLLGDAISPPIIGFVADLSSLHTAFLLTSVFILIGGGFWVAGAKYLDEDTRRASESAT